MRWQTQICIKPSKSIPFFIFNCWGIYMIFICCGPHDFKLVKTCTLWTNIELQVSAHHQNIQNIFDNHTDNHKKWSIRRRPQSVVRRPLSSSSPQYLDNHLVNNLDITICFSFRSNVASLFVNTFKYLALFAALILCGISHAS